MPLGIVPEPPAGRPDRFHEPGAIDAGGGRHGVTGRRPAFVRAARVVEESIVEIYEQGLHASTGSSAGAAKGGNSGRHTARKLHHRQMRSSSVFSKFASSARLRSGSLR